MKLIKKFIETSAVYLFGKIATYIVTFLMLRFYTSNITPANYGDYEYIYSLINVIIPALFLEVWSGVLRFAIGKENEDRNKVISTTFGMLVPAVIVYTAGYYLISTWLQWPMQWIVYAFAVLFMLVNIMMMISRALEKNILFVVSGIIGGLCNAGVGVFCVRVLHLQTEAMMYAMIANYLVQIVVLAVGTKIWRYLRISNMCKKTAKTMLLYCAPFLPNTILYYINTNYYMNVVRSYLGSDALGLFTVSTKFCIVVSFVVSVFHLAWQEITYSIYQDQNKKDVYRIGLDVFQYMAMLGTLLLLPLVKLLFPVFIGSEYSAANAYVPAYYSTVFFTAVSGFLYNTLAAEKITVFHPVTKLVSAAVNLILMYTLIGKIGIYAVILGAVASSAVEVFLLSFIIKKKIDLYVGIKKIWLFCGLYVVAALAYTYCGTLVNGCLIAVTAVVGIGYFVYDHRDVLRSFRKKA